MSCDFHLTRLEDITNALSDGLHKAPIFESGGEYIFVNATNLENGYIVDKDQEKHTNYGEYLKYGIPLSDQTILYSIDGTIGNIARYRGEKCILGKGACYITVKDNVNVDYIYYQLQSPHFKKYIHSMATGSTIRHISLRTMRNYEFYMPSYELQKKIASILLAIDDKIELNKRINENLEQQAKVVFSEWLNSCTESATIGELSKNILDYTPINDDTVRLLNSSDVTEGVFPFAPLVPNKDLKGHFKKRFQYGDILYSEIRPRNHHYGYVLFDSSNYIASTRLMIIRAIRDKVSPALLYQYLLLPEVEAEFTLKTESRSGTFPQGNYADMASIKVPYCSIDSQIEISETLTQIREIIALNQRANQRLAELRETLLPKLMSGELDVSNIDI